MIGIITLESLFFFFGQRKENVLVESKSKNRGQFETIAKRSQKSSLDVCPKHLLNSLTFSQILETFTLIREEIQELYFGYVNSVIPITHSSGHIK